MYGEAWLVRFIAAVEFVATVVLEETPETWLAAVDNSSSDESEVHIIAHT